MNSFLPFLTLICWFAGVASGCGWQHIGAYINFGAFYLWGIPIAASLAFWVHLKGVGLWIGIIAGAVLQTLLLALVTGCINWENQVFFPFLLFFLIHDMFLL